MTRSGAVSRHGKETIINRKIRDSVLPMLERCGFEVKKVPDSLNLVPSIKWVNNFVRVRSDGLALSIHLNCCGGKGAEVFYEAYRKASKAIAKKLVDEFCKETGMNNRGARSDTISRWKRLGWIRNTRCEAILIECGFIDNKGDVERVEDFERTARGICKGICKIFNVKYIESPREKPKSREEVEKIKKEIHKLLDQL